MRDRSFLPIFLLVFALSAPAAMADPSPEPAAFDQKDKKDKNKKDKRDKDWERRDDREWRDRDWDDDREHRGSQGIPPGHLPPPGECKVWYDDRPPGHQPPPTDCATARREAARTGGRVIYGGGRGDREDDRWDDRWEDDWDDDWDHRRNDRWDDDRWNERWSTGFDRMDRNDDGHISHSEWPGDDWMFNRVDRNDDGRLSRSEIRNRDFDRGDVVEERFRESDRNRDGRLSLREWWGRDEVFERLDLDNDGFLTRREILSSRT